MAAQSLKQAPPQRESVMPAKKHMLRYLSDWQTPDQEAMLRYLKRLGPGKGTAPAKRGGVWVNDGTLSPLTLYCFLKTTFGPPNGTMTLVREPNTDNLVHWDFVLAFHDAFIHIMATQRRIEIFLHANYETTPEDWQVLIRDLQRSFESKKDEMKKLREGLERWTTFVNPFRRVELVMLRLREQLDTVDLTPVPAPTEIVPSRDEVEAYLERRRKLYVENVKAATIGLSMRVLAPIMGEAFVNLVIFVLAKQEIRLDSRMMEATCRNPIDIRLKSLPLTCDRFLRPLDQSADEFKAFLRLMNQRNDLLHGNVDPKAFSIDTVLFDHKNIPLFNEDTSPFTRNLDASLRFIEPETAIRDFETVVAFIDFVLTHLEPRARAELPHILHASFPGFAANTKSLGVLFSEDLVESFMHSGPGGT